MRTRFLAVPVAAVLIGACGGSPHHGPSSGDNEKQALAFTRCLREHGINVPDPKPGSGGGVMFHRDARGNGPDPTHVQAATTACRKFAPNGGEPPSAADQQKMQDAALAFSRCMRSHGVDDFPDPKFSGDGGVTIGGPKSSFNPSSPNFKRAEGSCRSLMPGPKPADGPSFGTNP